MYSSQRMKDWNAIVSAYQKNNIYLAEAASILQRNVAYEIPALKKQINKCEQQHNVDITSLFTKLKLIILKFNFNLRNVKKNIQIQLKA